MYFLGRWILPLALLLGGCLALAGPALAQKKGPPRTVDDTQGDFFTERALKKANDIIADIKKSHGKDVFVETFKEVPKAYKDNPDKWAADRFRQLQVNGVYVLI